jgi:hypothetical protein
MTRAPGGFLAHHQGLILRLVLCAVFVLFVGMLVTVYLVAKEANPILLDEHGKPINAEAR